MSIEQYAISPTEDEIVAERTRLVQDLIIAIGLNLEKYATEATKSSTGGNFKTALLADPEFNEYWKLEYKETQEGEVSYSAIKLRTSKLVHARPNEHTYLAKDGEVTHFISKPRTTSDEYNRPIVDDNRLQVLELTILRLVPLSFHEERFVQASEQALGK